MCSEHWSYECKSGRCKKHQLVDKNTAISLPVCQVFCGEQPGTIWPLVNGHVDLKNKMARLSPIEIQFNVLNQTKEHEPFWSSVEQRFREQILAKAPHSVKFRDEGSHLMIMAEIEDPNAKLDLNTNEHYHIQAYENTGVVIVKIRAETVFGARHALETISQLIVFDNIRKELQMVGEFEIDDKPAYPHRGFLLDTGRNYFSIDSIKRTIGELINWDLRGQLQKNNQLKKKILTIL